MRAAGWLPGLLCQLSLVVPGAWEVRLHPRQEALVRTLASYEVVTPARVSERGQVFPHGRHFSRRRRSPEAPEPAPRTTHYRIRAYGQLFRLSLSADAAFLAAGYAEVHLGGPEQRRTGPADLRHCFYRGRVNAQRARTAVFSLCGGLMGTFKAHDGDYFLEPLMQADGSEQADDRSKPHLIYRQELKRSYFLPSHKPCEVSEIQVKKSTLPFHNHSNMHEDLNINKEIILGDPSNNISLEHERSQLHSRKKRFLSYPRYVEVMVTADAKMVRHHGQNLQHYVLTLMSIVREESLCAYLEGAFLGDVVFKVVWKMFLRSACIKVSSTAVLADLLVVTGHLSPRDSLSPPWGEGRDDRPAFAAAQLQQPEQSWNVDPKPGLTLRGQHFQRCFGPCFCSPSHGCGSCSSSLSQQSREQTSDTHQRKAVPILRPWWGGGGGWAAVQKQFLWPRCRAGHVHRGVQSGALQVAAIYKDSSIGNLINIVIVKLVVIHNEQEGPVISFNAATTLRNFCLWQQTQNVLDDTHPSHHDTAVLITREDICGAREKCDTLGLAELGTLCDPLRSCSVSEENGLSAAFTIAHELGHVFNVPHDDSFKCKETGIKHQYHVMAPTLNYHTSPWTWSKCSQKYITEFLDTGHGECLLDKPSGRAYDLSPQLPGLMYDGDKQCELTFGPGSQRQCQRLWCTSAEGVHQGCRTQHTPLADGTNCGPGMHCHHGLCVNKEMESRPVDGEWGPWGPYSSCSRTCGGGIKSTARLCNRPEPRNGGRFCVGRRMKFRSCSTDSCPKGTQDFREQQCSDFDGKHFNINGLSPNVRWLPKYSGIAIKDRCKLYCRVAGTTNFYQLKDRVADGTPCGTETNDVCVQGLCRQAGCDHVLNSKARRDKCGVCGGDNSSCRTMAGVFNSAHYGYNVVAKIPTGATSIDVVQHSYSGKPDDDNYLALSDTQGNFHLNGNFVVSMSKKEINIQGAIFEYSGSNNSIERINSTDRLEEELVLQVLCVGNLYNPDVRYSFNIPMEEGSDLFMWDPYGPWQDCTKMCQGLHRREITCIRKSDHTIVSDRRCDHLPLPLLVTERCNTDCELWWHVVSRSECSSRCGQGHRSLDVHCMRYSIHKGQTVPVGDRHCSDQLKPPTREPCRGGCVAARWHYSEWSQCSRSCGGGERSRESYCVHGFGHRLADRECRELPRVMMEICNEFSCPIWATSEWSECLVTCGKGTMQRQVWCQLDEDPLSDGFCNPSTKPESLKPCELHTCASWQIGPWGSCSATCGRGYQMRAVKCVDELLTAELDDGVCPSTSRPPDGQDCIVTPCPVIPKTDASSLPAVPVGKMAQWRHGSWAPCSVSCGRGTQARYVSCRDATDEIADESRCAHSARPAEISACFSPCGEWQTGTWSPCSASCGHGKTTRQVLCINYHHPINENYCDPEVRPLKEQDCDLAACPPTYSHFPSSSEQPSHFPGRNFPLTHKPEDNQNQEVHPSIKGDQWRTGPWGSCSSSCGAGLQRRAVVCQDRDGLGARHCHAASRPLESRHCDTGPCPRWSFGSWGECTQTCGGGVKARSVICQFPNGQMSQEQNCGMLNKPPSVAHCHGHACPDDVLWHRGPWKSVR
ncbi:hypothetical protein MC885_010158 [Smutsia gigantea]|nr:hypothetical protein MC885_010158 [Smutsia gigantea]